jgi:group II intron reverse transcriptase/maturase
MALFPIAQPKAHSLTGRITLSLLHAAVKAVKRNRGAAGIDKVSIKMFEANLDENLRALERSLKDGSFTPFPLRRKFIPKEPGKFRPLGIPAVRDRVAQEALRRLLHPIFEPLFHEASYGFRPGRNCHQALAQVLKLHEEGYQVVLDADIKGFFDNLPHAVIMEAVAAQVAEQAGPAPTRAAREAPWVQAPPGRGGVMEEGVFKPTTVGTPQGGVISPLLANIVLNHLDWRLHERGFRFVRYADDFVVLCQTRAQAKEALTLVTHTLSELGLSLSAEKTRITTYRQGYSFLGFVLSRRSRRMRDIQAEISRPSARADGPLAQPGRSSHRETQPSHPRHGSLLCDAVVHRPAGLPGTGRLDSAARALPEIQALQIPRQSPDAAPAVRATWAVEPGELLLAMRTATRQVMSKNGGRTPPRTGFTLSQRSGRRWRPPRAGVAGARKGHAGKYGEWTPLRQRGGSGGNTTPLPTNGNRPRGWKRGP